MLCRHEKPCSVCLAVWLNRAPPQAFLEADPPETRLPKAWTAWFSFVGEYLGEVSARTGPDPVVTDQKCNCEVCNAGR
jgi:hypothetical protein